MIFIRMQTRHEFVHVKSKLKYFKIDGDLNLIEFKKLVQVIQDNEPSAWTKYNLLIPLGGPNEKG